nr:hypothetical protein [Pseudonocardia sp. ICBG1142]
MRHRDVPGLAPDTVVPRDAQILSDAAERGTQGRLLQINSLPTELLGWWRNISAAPPSEERDQREITIEQPPLHERVVQCIIPVMQPGVHSDLLVILEVLFELAGASIRTSRSKSDIEPFPSSFEQRVDGLLAKQDYARRKSHIHHSYGAHLYNGILSLLRFLNRAPEGSSGETGQI